LYLVYHAHPAGLKLAEQEALQNWGVAGLCPIQLGTIQQFYYCEAIHKQLLFNL
jgi:hypothetical protein